MNTFLDQAVVASHQDGKITVTLESGQIVRFPVEGNPRLSGESDEDLSLQRFREGRYGQTHPARA